MNIKTDKIVKRNSLVFSVTYENYMKNVLNDKENKTLGQWKIDPDTIDQLKYAYAYLTNSNKMIVKKYEIDHFEFENAEKGYDHKDKYCLVFDKSEDVFFEYPYSPVQGRHYRNSEELDAIDKILQNEVNVRLELSKTSNVINNIKKTKPSSIDDARTRLNKIWKEEKKFNKISEGWESFSDDEYMIFSKFWIEQIMRIVKPNGNILIFGTYHNIYKLGSLLTNLERKINNSIIWYKRNC